jgi:hypothetical protein
LSYLEQLFTGVLTRIEKLFASNYMLHDSQFGDIFASMIWKSTFFLKGVFVDLQKSFDSNYRQAVWSDWKLLKIFRAMNNIFKSGVKLSNLFSDFNKHILMDRRKGLNYLAFLFVDFNFFYKEMSNQ